MCICQISVPYFQREYRWGEDNWNESLNSIEKISTGEEYFMGSLILNIQNQGCGFPIIDGQQRLTTLSIFLKALSDAFDKNKQIEKLIIFNTNHNRKNQDSFQKVMSIEYKNNFSIVKDKKDYEKKWSIENDQIQKCYDYFRMKIDEIDKNGQKIYSEETIDNFFKNLDKIKFGIILLPEEHQQDIFDRLNTNAVALTQAELIKNYLFNNDIEGWKEKWLKHFEENDKCSAYWDKMLYNKRNIDIFLFSICYIKNQSISKAIKNDDLIKTIKNENKDKWISWINENAENYRECIKIDIEKQNLENPLDRINLIIFVLGYYSIIPYIFYIYKSNKDKDAIYKYLEKYLTVRMITEESTQGYNNFFVDLIDDEKNIKDHIDETKNKNLKIPSAEEIEIKFKERHWKNEKAKLLLYLIEDHLDKEDKNATKDNKLKPFGQYALEHIIPQKPQKWEDFCKNINKEEKRNDYIYNIGNMIFITGDLNKYNSNSSREDKAKNMKDKMDGVKTFKNKDVIYDVSRWSEIYVEERMDILLEKLKKMYDL